MSTKIQFPWRIALCGALAVLMVGCSGRNRATGAQDHDALGRPYDGSVSPALTAAAAAEAAALGQPPGRLG